jgi:hypothetical protein
MEKGMKTEPKFKVGDILKIKPSYQKLNPYHTIKIKKVYINYMKKEQYGYKFEYKTSLDNNWKYCTHRPEYNLAIEYDHAH